MIKNKVKFNPKIITLKKHIIRPSKFVAIKTNDKQIENNIQSNKVFLKEWDIKQEHICSKDKIDC
jgi:hypothetical protein